MSSKQMTKTTSSARSCILATTVSSSPMLHSYRRPDWLCPLNVLFYSARCLPLLNGSASRLKSMSESVDRPLAVTAEYAVVSPEVRLYYEIRSSPSVTSGKSLKMIMIMGAFATIRHYEEQAQFLVEHFTRLHLPIEVLTYDHRGIGKSSTTVSIRQTSSMLANDALALLSMLFSVSDRTILSFDISRAIWQLIAVHWRPLSSVLVNIDNA
jgi:hypothetical protein